MLKTIKYNGKDFTRRIYLSTVCLYKTQEEMDLDVQEKTDKRAVKIINNNISFDNVKGLAAEEITNYIKQQGENLYNARETQEFISDIENMPNLTSDGITPMVIE